MPKIEPRCRYQLKVSDIHTLAIKEYGSEDGYPIVLLHGGPGSGCHDYVYEPFDLQRFRVIAPDQRGAGNSTPKGCLEENNTSSLVGDLERIREHLGVEKWMVVGGSWGALLALVYAESFPRRVSGLVVRSLFMGNSFEIRQAFIELPKIFYPNLYKAFIHFLSVEEIADPLESYYQRILNSDPAIHKQAIWVWHDYERALSVLHNKLPEERILAASLSPNGDDSRSPLPNTPRLEAHYFSNDCFLSRSQLIKESDHLRDIPGVIIQARYDLLCPPENSHLFASCWPAARIAYVEGAGHSQSEVGIAEEIQAAVEEIADKLSVPR